MQPVMIAALAAAVGVVCGVLLYRAGRAAELARQRSALTDAESVRRRLTADAEREAESLRKTAVVAGKEELIALREAWEVEGRQRREDVEREEKRIKERDT